jgi:pimeloyl-ACP methyl ester carboxylesterase
MTAPLPGLTHRLEGEGPPVALLNGGMMTFASWGTVAERLSARYRVLSFDFRGQLLSPGEPPSEFAGHVADLAALLDAVGWESAHFVGASFGAMAGIEFAARWPARVRSLTAITAMDRETPEFRWQADTMREIAGAVARGDGGAAGARERFYDALVRSVYSEAWRRANAEAIAARRAQVTQLPLAWFSAIDVYLEVLRDFDLTADLERIRCPSQVVIAANDRVMDERRSRALAARLGAEVFVHPTAGHGLVVEDPEWLAGVCLRFLDATSAGP